MDGKLGSTPTKVKIDSKTKRGSTNGNHSDKAKRASKPQIQLGENLTFKSILGQLGHSSKSEIPKEHTKIDTLKKPKKILNAATA